MVGGGHGFAPERLAPLVIPGAVQRGAVHRRPGTQFFAIPG